VIGLAAVVGVAALFGYAPDYSDDTLVADAALDIAHIILGVSPVVGVIAIMCICLFYTFDAAYDDGYVYLSV
ncbi:hypothetical protein, partial [Enterobacter hormaechei]